MKRFGILVAALFVFMIVLVSNTNMDADAATVLFFVGIPVAAVVSSCISRREAADPAKQTGVLLYRDKNGNGGLGSYTLIVSKRTANNKRVLKIAEHLGQSYTYNPAKVVYTGATVGGVTTGGFHTVDAHHTYNVYASGKYKLQYTEVSPDGLAASPSEYPPYDIEMVRLDSQSLVEEAKNNPVISRHLKGRFIMMADIPADAGKKLAAAGKSGNQTMMMNALASVAAERGLTKDDATAILNWLCHKQ